ncbi:universal stress protein [Salinirubellus salinus]|uniref:Universal stress protein n=1 Tax=Salinirubellus salinus TaxID=1364945 RepID=A0A9E7R6S0_9EURY|nr:universal stress protein [Salinirubellus salinus]UWM56229.1 universal stress protein [Salinirubellus salinus]
MTVYLVATASAETTTAACDYLLEKLTPDDAVYVLSVEEPDVEEATETAFEEAQTRLTEVAEVRTIRRRGQPAQEIVALAREIGADEIIVGPRRDAPGGFSTIGTTTRAVLSTVEVPVFVVPRDP